jgi:hypothetical protein
VVKSVFDAKARSIICDFLKRYPAVLAEESPAAYALQAAIAEAMESVAREQRRPPRE